MRDAIPPLERLIAENIDALVNLDVSGYGVIGALHRAARAHHGEPLAALAARRLAAALKPGDDFIVTCGWLMPGFYPYGETDGPIGAATLGRALAIGLGARMIVVTEAEMAPIVAASCRAAGLNVMTEADLAAAPRPPHPRNLHCLVVPFPIPEAEGRLETERLFETYRPKAVLAVEKNGPNEEGRYCMVDGDDNSDCVIKAGLLYEAARARGALTIGIGDRGNEIGFGAIREVPRDLLPHGRAAADATTVDVLVTAAVSNWGASAIAAALAVHLDRPDVMHDEGIERGMLEATLRAGGIDGFACRPVPFTDGLRAEAHVGLAALLGELVRAPAARGPHIFSTPVSGG